MLKLVEEISELDYLPADPFCAKITAIAKTYGTGYDFVRFYVQEQSCAISIIDGNMTAWCNDNADFEELRAFTNIMGFATLQCSEEVIKKIGFEPDNSSYIVKYTGDRAVKPSNFTDNWDFKEIYNLLCKCEFDMGDYNYFLTDVCARINKGTCTFGGIADKELMSCAFRLFEGNKSALLGAVATSPEHRGKSLASSLVPYMAQGEKDVFLFCRNDGLLKFYEKCGFSCYGKWAVKNMG